MTDDQSTIFIITAVMMVGAFTHRKGFTYEIYKNYSFVNKKALIIEKLLMIILPVLFSFLYVIFSLHPIVIRIWLILVLFLDFALQFLYKSCSMIEGDIKRSWNFVYWFIFIVALFLTIK